MLISRKHHTLRDAIDRLLDMGFCKKKLDITDNYYRFRQLDPSEFKRFRIKRIAPDVMFVIGFHTKA